MERTDTPWPVWMLRFIATDAPSALDDLTWSVGGSPPYGGVSYDEASAVYDFLEQYRGPGMAPQSAYDAVLRLAGDKPDAVDVLDIFRCYDEVTSSPDSFAAEPVERGLELCRKVNHTGAQATFLAFSMLAIGLNVVVGYAGLLDLGYVAFFGIAGYAYAYLSSDFIGGGVHVPSIISLPLIVVFTAGVGWAIGSSSLRLRGDYLQS